MAKRHFNSMILQNHEKMKDLLNFYEKIQDLEPRLNFRAENTRNPIIIFTTNFEVSKTIEVGYSQQTFVMLH